MTELNENKIAVLKAEIDKLSHEALARIYRHSTVGNIYFTTPELYKHFITRFNSFGGWNPQLSKKIGW